MYASNTVSWIIHGIFSSVNECMYSEKREMVIVKRNFVGNVFFWVDFPEKYSIRFIFCLKMNFTLIIILYQCEFGVIIISSFKLFIII